MYNTQTGVIYIYYNMSYIIIGLFNYYIILNKLYHKLFTLLNKTK